ncbi:MAG TPA: CopD family protein [Rhodothermales bacterium]|nr:CopD family protein [Rhodothermales bacterium]
MPPEPLIPWPEPIFQFIGFVGTFLAVGAVGFYFTVLRRRLAMTGETLAEADRPAYVGAGRRAAVIGLIGSIIGAVQLARILPGFAARQHVSVGQLLTSNVPLGLGVLLTLVALLGFALAVGKLPVGWVLAAIGAIFSRLPALFAGRWAGLINPLHMLAASLWIGTLFVLVTAGITVVLRHEATRERRGVIVADMVNAFSPFALVMGLLVIGLGVTTALRHLHPFSSLWSTPYGYTLIIKLCVVATVFTLGTWNWRRQRPRLGTEPTAVAIRRSATGELVAATIVLIITAILVSLPSPQRYLRARQQQQQQEAPPPSPPM